MLYDVAVVGGSAAGLTAALYTARQGLKTLIVTKDIGGQMLLTSEIQNYPGVASIGGFELANKFKEQAELYGAQFIYEEAARLEEHRECPGLCFRVKTTRGEFFATTVILAFGKTPRDLGVPGEEKLKGRGVSHCAICDGPLFKGKTVAVVGTGDQALEAANYLANIASTIYVIHSYDRPVGTEQLVDQVTSLPNTKLVPNSKVSGIKGDSRVEKVVVVNTETGESREIDIDGIFIEIGYVAKTGWLENVVALTARGQIEVDRECRTSHPGIFAAGDVTDNPYAQVIISAGQGCTAALSAYNYIQRLKGKGAARVDWRSMKSSVSKKKAG